MSVRVGDIAKENGPYECIECGEIVHLSEGDEVPMCSCGGMFYLERMAPEAINQDDDRGADRRRPAA